MNEGRFLMVGSSDGLTATLGKALAATGAEVVFTPLDLADPVALAGQVAQLEPFDAALLVPGWRQFGPFIELDAAGWDEAIGQNFTQMTYAAQALARRLIADGHGGRLIFVTSALALLPFAGAIALGTTLAALHGIARMAAVDLAPYGITVNVLAPGWLEGEQFDALPAAVQAHIQAGIPLGRPSSVAEIAAVIRILASEVGRGITGAVIPVDGGYTLTPAPGHSLFEPG